MAASEQQKKIRKKKRDVTITMSPYLKLQLDNIIDLGEFTSISELITHASTEFIVRYKLEKENESAVDVLIKILETPEGKELFDKIIKENSKKSLSNIIENGTIEDEDVEI